MSLAIDPAEVREVLLVDGHWHCVVAGSFTLDAYEFVDGEFVLHGGGASGVCATGFMFVDRHAAVRDEVIIVGPLSAIVALRLEGRA